MERQALADSPVRLLGLLGLERKDTPDLAATLARQ